MKLQETQSKPIARRPVTRPVTTNVTKPTVPSKAVTKQPTVVKVNLLIYNYIEKSRKIRVFTILWKVS